MKKINHNPNCPNKNCEGGVITTDGSTGRPCKFCNPPIKKKKMNPSDFEKIRPMASAKGKAEAETVAQNIMTILSRNGDIWRKLTMREYKAERLKDGDYSTDEEEYFVQVVDYCISPDTAKLFAPSWKVVVEKVSSK